MKFKIYQINTKRDKKRVAFMGYDSLPVYQEGLIDRSIYDLVYEGEEYAADLEGIYKSFNVGPKPEGYSGRSLSVSDVVEVIEAEKIEPGLYFCDNCGFKTVEWAFFINTPEWIDAGVELPANETEVLVCTRSKNGSRNVDKGYYNGERFVHRDVAEVTHWMPLPDLPEEGGIMKCKDCKYYSELEEPREFEYSFTIYGYCYKGAADASRGYPVYIPEGKCKDYKKRFENERNS